MQARRLRCTAAAVLILLPLAASVAAQPAQARTGPAASRPAIAGMSLDSDAGVSAGATLRVQVHATPDARSASLVLGDSGISVPLQQQSPGTYVGRYVVRRHDRIDPTQRMTARLAVGDRSYSREFNYPPGFQSLAMGNAPQQLAIERFVVRFTRDREPGRELHFRLTGARGAEASVDIPGVVQDVALAETRPGVYEGSYTIRERDDPDRFRSAVATLRSGSQSVRSRVDLGDRDEDAQAARDDRHDGRQAAGALPLAVTSYRDNAVVDAQGDLAIEGRTVPYANVRVQVESVADVDGVLGLTQPVADRTVQADRDGRFRVAVAPRELPVPGTRYRVHLTASSGSQTAEQLLTLIQRRG